MTDEEIMKKYYNFEDVVVEITEDEYNRLSGLSDSDLCREIYKYAKASTYDPVTRGCVTRKLKKQNNKYYVTWKTRRISNFIE